MNVQDLEAQYKKLGAEIERLKAKPTGVLEPEEGEKFWYVPADGEPLDAYWNAFCTYSQGVAARHNVYKTEELAKKANVLMRRSNWVIQACLNFDPDFEPDWSDHNQVKYQFYYSYFCERWRGHNVSTSDWGAACVSTKEKSDLVLEYLNSQDIK